MSLINNIPIQPFTLDDVKCLLGADDFDSEDYLKELCTNSSINPMSKWKPTAFEGFVHAKNVPYIYQAREKSPSSQLYAMGQAYGISKPVITIAHSTMVAKTVYGSGWLRFNAAVTGLYMASWTYTKPSKHFRLLDFHGYIHSTKFTYPYSHSTKPYLITSIYCARDKSTSTFNPSCVIGPYQYEDYHPYSSASDGSEDAALLGLESIFGRDTNYSGASDKGYFGLLIYSPTDGTRTTPLCWLKFGDSTSGITWSASKYTPYEMGAYDSVTGSYNMKSIGSAENIPYKSASERSTYESEYFVSGDTIYVIPVVIIPQTDYSSMGSSNSWYMYAFGLDSPQYATYVLGSTTDTTNTLFIDTFKATITCRYLDSGDYKGCYLIYCDTATSSTRNKLTFSVGTSGSSQVSGNLVFTGECALNRHDTLSTERDIQSLQIGTKALENGNYSLAVTSGNTYLPQDGRSAAGTINGMSVLAPYVILHVSDSASTFDVSLSLGYLKYLKKETHIYGTCTFKNSKDSSTDQTAIISETDTK